MEILAILAYFRKGNYFLCIFTKAVTNLVPPERYCLCNSHESGSPSLMKIACSLVFGMKL